MRVKPPPSGDRWLQANGGYGLFVAIRCQAVGGCELSLHRLATGGYGERWLRTLRSHPLPSGGAARVRPPPSGDRWLRATGGYGERWLRTLCSHPLPSGGGVRGRPPPSGDRWLRRTVATALRSHPLPSGGAVRVTPPPSGDRWLRATGGYGSS